MPNNLKRFSRAKVQDYMLLEAEELEVPEKEPQAPETAEALEEGPGAPPEEAEKEPQPEKEEEEDPREELVRRLTEYKMYKYAAEELKDLSVDAQKVFFKPETVPEEIKYYEEPIRPEEIVGDITLETRYSAWSCAGKRTEKIQCGAISERFRKKNIK